MFALRPYGRQRGLARGEDWLPMMQWPAEFGQWLSQTPAISGGFRVDIQETEGSYVLEAELPGIDKDNIHVEVENDSLTIKVEQDERTEQKEEHYLRRERRFSRCQRSFYLGDIDHEKIDAQYKDGVLRIELPKLEPGKPKQRRIDIH